LYSGQVRTRSRAEGPAKRDSILDTPTTTQDTPLDKINDRPYTIVMNDERRRFHTGFAEPGRLYSVPPAQLDEIFGVPEEWHSDWMSDSIGFVRTSEELPGGMSDVEHGLLLLGRGYESFTFIRARLTELGIEDVVDRTSVGKVFRFQSFDVCHDESGFIADPTINPEPFIGSVEKLTASRDIIENIRARIVEAEQVAVSGQVIT